MAFTSTAVKARTGGDIITEALEVLGVLAEGESASTAQNTSSLASLNNLIKLRSADTQIFAQGEYQLDLVASTSAYTLGTGNVGYIPTKVLNATLINTTDNNEIPITPLTQEEWYALTTKTSESRPTQYYAKRNEVGVSMDFNVWPVPSDTTYDIKLWLQYPYRDIDATTDDVWFTQEWYMELVFELAYVLSFKYGVDIVERSQIKQAMDMYLDIAESYDVDGSVYFQPRAEHG